VSTISLGIIFDSVGQVGVYYEVMRVFSFFVFSLFCLFFFGIVSAATPKKSTPISLPVDFGPQILLTWKAQNYTPIEYAGKSIPVGNTSVLASMELLDNGKLVDLTDIRVNWYLDGEFFDGGLNKHSILIRLPKLPINKILIRAEIQNYKESDIVRAVEIQPIRPEVVIESGYPYSFLYSLTHTLKATVYYFNVKNPTSLVYAWKVNDVAATSNENPSLLDVVLPDSTPNKFLLTTSLSVTDPESSSLFSSALVEKVFTFIKNTYR
jgi:hypothetical protein